MSGYAIKRDLAERIFFRTYQCDSLIHKTASQSTSKFGLSSHQWIILGALSYPEATEGITVGDMAELLRVSRQSLTPILSRLESAGYIERLQCDRDARAKVIRLAPAGVQVWQDMQASMNDFFEQALKGFSVDDHIATLHMFNRLLENLTAFEPPSE